MLFSDLDYFGHVNNAVYLTYFELARMELWFRITGGQNPIDISFIMARAEVDFRRPLYMERIEICVRVSEMRTSSLDFVYEIRKSQGSEIAATGKVVVVLFDWEKRSKVAISEELRQKVKACSPDAF